MKKYKNTSTNTARSAIFQKNIANKKNMRYHIHNEKIKERLLYE